MIMAQCRILWVVISTVGFVVVCSENPVSGLPKKPENVSVHVKGMGSRQYYVHWQVPRDSSGAVINVSYTVRFRSVKRCSDQPLDVKYGCEITLHSGANIDDFLCKVKADPINAYCDFNVSVIGNASAGEVESYSVFVPLPYLPTPLPPLRFEVHATENQEIRVSWEGRQLWQSYDVQYMIVYHADGETSNRTATVTNEHHRTLKKKDGIEAFKTYYLYLKAVVIIDSAQQSTSDTIGPERISTPAGEPSPPPTIVGYKSHTLDDKTFRNVTITWEVPTQRAWLGLPASFLIYYRVYPQGSTAYDTVIDTVLNVTDTSLNNTVLAGLKSTQNYHVFMKMCNTKKCSAAGEAHIIKALFTNNKGSTQPVTQIAVIVSVSAVVFLIVVSLVGVYYYRKKRRERPPLRPLQEFVIEPNTVDYEHIQANSRNEYHHLEQDSD